MTDNRKTNITSLGSLDSPNPGKIPLHIHSPSPSISKQHVASKSQFQTVGSLITEYLLTQQTAPVSLSGPFSPRNHERLYHLGEFIILKIEVMQILLMHILRLKPTPP